MINRYVSLKSFCFIVLLCSVSLLYAQEDCKVMMPEISGTYTGKCKKGLAHGKGKYTWADGRMYEGSWLAGERDGKGKMTYPTTDGDSIVTGYWKKDDYVGTELIPPYRVWNQMHSQQHDVYFDFTINEPGTFEVTITN